MKDNIISKLKRNIKNKNGITLIALVITIIVMLILVAVTITMAVNGKLFEYAGQATHDTELAKQNELKIAEGSLVVDGNLYNSPQDFIDGIEATPKYSPSLLDSNKVLTKTAEYTDGQETAIIPKGFGIVQDCETINQGLVISDEFDSNGNSIGNEFVWIPVEYTASNTDTNNNELDDAFEVVFYRSAWSDNARSTDYTTNTTYIENASNDPTGKYNEMMLSVQNYKGFYIGRYEAGSTTPRTSDTPGTTTLVVKRDAFPYNYVCWGIAMNDYETPSTYTSGSTSYDYGRGAVYLSKNMYTDSTKYGVVSTLCYGVQWDTMLDFIKDNNHNVTSSTDWGNYNNTNGDVWRITRTTAKYYKNNEWNEITENLTKESAGSVLLTTGANDNFKTKNIFDVAGNCLEWTMEAYSTSYQLSRGGDFSNYGNGAASYRSIGEAPSTVSRFHSFRPALYIN